MKKEDLKDPSNMEQEVSEESASENTEASAEEETKETGYNLIKQEIKTAPLDERVKKDVIEKLEKIKNGEIDLYF